MTSDARLFDKYHMLMFVLSDISARIFLFFHPTIFFFSNHSSSSSQPASLMLETTSTEQQQQKYADQGRLRIRSSASSRSTSPVRSAPYHTKPQQQRAAGMRPPQPPSGGGGGTWQQLVVHASSAAGTTAAVVSEESMKCLKYCLSWLQYAVQHIEQQMTLLRNFLVSLATSSTTTSSSTNSLAVPGPSPSILSSIKKDIVDTLRKVVDVISKYAGSSLPQHARVAVRGFILNLPSRWVGGSPMHILFFFFFVCYSHEN